MRKTLKLHNSIPMLSCLLLTAVGSLSAAQAATYVVDTTSDNADLNACTVAAGDCSLRGAIGNANTALTNDTINFDSSLNDTSIVLNGSALYVTNNGSLIINGLGATRLSVSGNNVSRVFNIDSGAVVTIDALKIMNGYSSDYFGGGIYANQSTLTLTNSVISNNSCFYSGGGIFKYEGALTLTNTVVSGNSAGLEGGGIANTLGTSTLTNSNISGNTATENGGGIYNGYGTTTLTNSTLSNNAAGTYGSGGGLYSNNEATSTVTNSTLSGNSAYSGGGIGNSGATTTLTNSTISGNSAGVGAGFYNVFNATATLINSTLSGNTGSRGGGIANSGSTVTLSNSTLTGNSSASDGGGGIYNSDSSPTVSLGNTIVAGNTAFYAYGADTYGAIASSGYNLIGVNDYTTAGWVSTDKLGSQATPLNAKLLPLADNGGPTKTHALDYGSPAFDGGNSILTTDQRGLSRPIDLPSLANAVGGNGSDIGAVEMQSLPIPTGPSINIGGVRVDRGLFIPAEPMPGRAGLRKQVQFLTLQNKSGAAINGPVYLVLDNLSRANLTNASGFTTITPSGSAYIAVNVGNDNVFSVNEKVTVQLNLTPTSFGSITYNTRVLAGAGTP